MLRSRACDDSSPSASSGSAAALAWAILGSTLLARSSTSFDGLGGSVRALWGPPLQQRAPLGRLERGAAGRRAGSSAPTSRGGPTWWSRAAPAEVRHPRAAGPDRPRRARSRCATGARGCSGSPPTTCRSPAATPSGTTRRERAGGRGALPAGAGRGGLRRLRGARRGRHAGGGRLRRGRGRASPAASRRARRVAFAVAYRSRGTERWSYGAEGEGLGPEAGRARQVPHRGDHRLRRGRLPRRRPLPLQPRGRPAAAGAASGASSSWSGPKTGGVDAAAAAQPRPAGGPRSPSSRRSGSSSSSSWSRCCWRRARRSIHPMNYFLLGCAFFAFHLLFAYLIDHLEVAPAFAARLAGLGRAGGLLRPALPRLAGGARAPSASRSSSTWCSSRSPSSGRASPASR